MHIGSRDQRCFLGAFLFNAHPYRLPQAADVVRWCLFGARLMPTIWSPAPSKLVRSGRWRPEKMVGRKSLRHKFLSCEQGFNEATMNMLGMHLIAHNTVN